MKSDFPLLDALVKSEQDTDHKSAAVTETPISSLLSTCKEATWHVYIYLLTLTLSLYVATSLLA